MFATNQSDLCAHLFFVGSNADGGTLTFTLGAGSVAGHPFAITDPQATGLTGGDTHDSTLTLASGFLDFDTDTLKSYVLEIK